jgi:hypothetical protein
LFAYRYHTNVCAAIANVYGCGGALFLSNDPRIFAARFDRAHESELLY